MDIKKLKETYPDAVPNTKSALKRCYLPDIAQLESYKLTGTGTVLLMDGDEEVIISSYPRLEAPKIENDIPILAEDYVVEYKIDGYNVRLVYLKSIDNFVALLRGGFICAQTTTILREAFGSELMNFFKNYPDIVLCMEVIGKKSVNAINYEFNEERWGFGNVGYFIFDAFDKGRAGKWYDADFIDNLKSMNLSTIPRVGILNNGEILAEKMEDIDNHFDGVVIKSAKQRDGEHIYKLRWEYFIKKFQNKIKIKDKSGNRSERPEVKILDHFMQGYPEPELGLNEGISPAELEEFENKIKILENVVQNEKALVGKTVGEISDWLIKILVDKGNFDEDMQKKLLKGVRNRLGGFVGRSMSKESREARTLNYELINT